MSSKVINSALFVAPALVFAFPGSYWLVSVIFSVIGIMTILRPQTDAIANRQSLHRIPMLWGFVVFIILHVALTAYHQEPAKDFGNVLPFVLSPLVLIAIIRNEPDPHYFWYGCATGALLSFIIALAQVYLLDAGRAYGFSNAITFGDTAIVLGTSALVGLFYGYAGFQHSYQRAYLLVGGASGLISSLLSGSKGGWLSLVMVIVLLASAATRSFSLLRRLSIAFGLCIALVVFIAWMPKLPVLDRIVSAYHGAKIWIQTGEITEGSASIRLEAFKAGLLAGAHSPIVGLGRQGQLSVMQQAVSEGQINPIMIEKKVVDGEVSYSVFSIDNDLINLFARQGLLGIIGALAVHVGIFISFWRYRDQKHNVINALSTLGLLLVLLYFEFGLSISVFGVSIFRVIYATWAVLLLGLLMVERDRLADVIRK